MKILSLFDGISCARVALERAGIPVEFYAASETDKYAIQIAEKNYTEGVSDTQRYKALGNAFNVEVIIHILKHLPWKT